VLVIKQLEAFGVGNSEVFCGLRSSQNVEMDVFRLLLVSLAGWMNRQQQEVIDYLQEEVRVPKEMAEKQGGKRLRFTDDQRARLARKAKGIRFGCLKEIANLVTPQILLAWHRKLAAMKVDGSGERTKVGRSPTAQELRDLVVKIAEENRTWGCPRIQGAMANLGHVIGRGTIAAVLKGAGMEPAPEQERKSTQAEFLRTHWEVLARISHTCLTSE
jgi:putative transposase